VPQLRPILLRQAQIDNGRKRGRTAGKIRDQVLMNFEELWEHEKRLRRRILADLEEAFRGEWETHANGQPRLIPDMDWHIIWLPETGELLNMRDRLFYIRCPVPTAYGIESRSLEPPFIPGLKGSKPEELLWAASWLDLASRYSSKDEHAKRVRNGEATQILRFRHRRRRNVLGTVIAVGVSIRVGPRLRTAFRKYIHSRTNGDDHQNQ
jgi:hypothetical protein